MEVVAGAGAVTEGVAALTCDGGRHATCPAGSRRPFVRLRVACMLLRLVHASSGFETRTGHTNDAVWGDCMNGCSTCSPDRMAALVAAYRDPAMLTARPHLLWSSPAASHDRSCLLLTSRWLCRHFRRSESFGFTRSKLGRRLELGSAGQVATARPCSGRSHCHPGYHGKSSLPPNLYGLPSQGCGAPPCLIALP